MKNIEKDLAMIILALVLTFNTGGKKIFASKKSISLNLSKAEDEINDKSSGNESQKGISKTKNTVNKKAKSHSVKKLKRESKTSERNLNWLSTAIFWGAVIALGLLFGWKIVLIIVCAMIVIFFLGYLFVIAAFQGMAGG